MKIGCVVWSKSKRNPAFYYHIGIIKKILIFHFKYPDHHKFSVLCMVHIYKDNIY